jgi:hypothetical protein
MEEIKKVKDKAYVFFQLLSFIQWLIAIIFSSGTTIVVVILMPTINLFVAVLLGLGILIGVAFFMLAANILILKKEEITQTKDIEEQRRKDEREPIKESLKRQINKFISCWENGKQDYQKRIRNGIEFQKDLLDVGNTLKKQIGDDEKKLPQTIIVEANDIADDIIGLAKRMRPRVIVKVNDEKDIQKYKKTIDDGNLLVEKARELIEKLDDKNE